MLSKDCGNCLLAVLGFDDIVAVTGKTGLQHTTNLRLVVNHENSSVAHRSFWRFHIPRGALPASVVESISEPIGSRAANSAWPFQPEPHQPHLLRMQSLRGILIAIRRIITTEWFERHPRAPTTDTHGRKKTLSKSGTFY